MRPVVVGPRPLPGRKGRPRATTTFPVVREFVCVRGDGPGGDENPKEDQLVVYVPRGGRALGTHPAGSRGETKRFRADPKRTVLNAVVFYRFTPSPGPPESRMGGGPVFGASCVNQDWGRLGGAAVRGVGGTAQGGGDGSPGGAPQNRDQKGTKTRPGRSAGSRLNAPEAKTRRVVFKNG